MDLALRAVRARQPAAGLAGSRSHRPEITGSCLVETKLALADSPTSAIDINGDLLQRKQASRILNPYTN